MYRVEVSKKAKKDLKKVDTRYKRRVLAAIAYLGEDPWRGNKLEGELKHRCAVRVWPYRILYTVDKKHRKVVVVRIGHRQSVYR